MSDHLARRVRAFLDEREAVMEGLHHEGSRVVALALARRKISLRELARRAGCSPTYLCQVSYGRVRISPEVYVRVSEIAKGK